MTGRGFRDESCSRGLSNSGGKTSALRHLLSPPACIFTSRSRANRHLALIKTHSCLIVEPSRVNLLLIAFYDKKKRKRKKLIC